MSLDMVLSIIARDRPGLVRTLADAVAAHGGNWIDSSMARLGGEFAGIVRIEIPQASVPALELALGGMAEQGITVVTKRTEAGTAVSGATATLELTGGDHPGIVRDISAALAAEGASIETLDTRVFPGSMSGEQLFSAKARVVLPETVTIERLRDALEAIAQDIMVEIELKEVD
jgi:glycine cleavage system regulatory protein